MLQDSNDECKELPCDNEEDAFLFLFATSNIKHQQIASCESQSQKQGAVGRRVKPLRIFIYMN